MSEKYRPLGTECPWYNRDSGGTLRKCRGKLIYKDYQTWVYIECPKCGQRWIKDDPDPVAAEQADFDAHVAAAQRTMTQHEMWEDMNTKVTR